MVIARKLNPREERARLNLNAIWKERKETHGLTHQDVNKSLGWSNSVFGQYLTGRIALNPKTVMALADYFYCYPTDIDPKLKVQTKESQVDVVAHAVLLEPQAKKDLAFLLSKQLATTDQMQLMKTLVDEITQSKN